ncbi:MAG TPA: hypothetical protein VFB59_00765 [Candidatus Saccharimonadales bacterium]|nr:hypothetical protein [Candidatus Saccharimonadales bacterium]
MNNELIPTGQPTGVCDPRNGEEVRVVRIEDDLGNIRQSVGAPDRVTSDAVRGFERQHVSYVVTESSEAGRITWPVATQEPVHLTPVPATQTRPFKGSSLESALRALQDGPSTIIVRSAEQDALPDTPNPLPIIAGNFALQSTLLEKDHFTNEDISTRFAGRIVGHLRWIGVWTFADVLAMGRAEMMAHLEEAGYNLRDKSWQHIGAIVAHHTGIELADERAPVAQLSGYYDNIAHATPALVLPQAGFPHYKSLGLVGANERRITIGDLADAYQNNSLDAITFKTSKPALERLGAFVHHILIKGLIEPFNAINR